MAAILLIGCTGCGSKKSHVRTITNVSYDPTREFYEAYNPLFEKYYKEKTGKEVNIIQSHGGSGAQARSVVEGCNADVVTLALEHDITLIEQTGLIENGWEQEFADDSSPYTSTIVFLVRKGNPKQIKDWDDLVNKKVEIITPDPKSSGGACWNFLAALSYIKEQTDDEKEQKAFLQKLYSQVSVMDSGARGSCYFFLIGINAPIGFWFVVHNTNGKSISNLFRIGYNLPAILRKFLFRYLTSNVFHPQHIVLSSVFHRCVINASAPIVKAVWQLLRKVFR